MPGSRRFSQAISEGDGISVIVPVGSVDEARAAEAQGAEAVLVDRAIPDLRAAIGLPILWRADGAPEQAESAGADALIVVVEHHADEGDRLERICALAESLGLEYVLDVCDDEELELAMERVDPEVFLLSSREAGDEDPVDHVLDILPDVPAGKLAIADARVQGREDVLALERAGVDAVVVGAGDVAGLVGGPYPEV